MFLLDMTLVAESLGRDQLTGPEFAQAQVWASEAVVLIKNALGPVEDLDQDVLQMVVRWAVIEMIKRPDAATEVTTSVDDATSTRRYEKSAGRVSILPEWLAMLTPSQADDGGAFSIRLHHEPDRRRPHGWCR